MTASDLGAGPAAWRAYLASTLESRDERTPYILARIALLTDQVFQTPQAVSIPGMPGGRPDKAGIRAAAQALLERADSADATLAATWRFLGLQQRFRYLQAPQPGEPAEFAEALASLEEVVRVGERLGPDTHGWALIKLAITLRNVHRAQEALEVATRATVVLREAGDPPDGPFALLVEATGGSSWFLDHPAARRYLRLKAHERTALVARMLRNYPRAMAERDQEIALAQTLKEQRPVRLVSALGHRATLSRVTGDVVTSAQLLEQQHEFVLTSGSHEAYVRQLLSAADAAKFHDDWDGTIRLRSERITARLAEHLPHPQILDPTSLLETVHQLENAGLRSWLTHTANDTYMIARCIIESGRAEIDPEQRDMARRWLTVSDAAWSDNGLNSKIATAFRQLELDSLDGIAGDALSVGRQMVELSRAWLRADGERESAVIAVKHGEPGDPVIFDRLTELIEVSPSVDLAHLWIGTAHWHLRHGHALAERDQIHEALEEWSRAVRDSEAATVGLAIRRDEGPPVLLDAAKFVQAHFIQAEAIQARREAGSLAETDSQEAELAVRVASLPAVAQRFIACGTPRQRHVLDHAYGPWLSETLRLAALIGDLDAADHTAEVMRRDLVGGVLFAIATDELVPEQIATLARQLTAALAVRTVDDGADTSDSEPATGQPPDADDDQGEGSDASPKNRALGIAEQIDETLDVVGGILSPVARSLFDPRTVLQHTTRTAARSLYPDGPGVLLSLVHIDDAYGSHVARRMSWRAGPGQAFQDYLDIVPAPSWLTGLAVDDDSGAFFVRVVALTETLLPPPLIDLLANADEADPVPLTVVPTGLLAVPFAALPIDERLLLDVAVVSVVQSLQAIETLTRTDVSPSVEMLEVGVYDTIRLEHTAYEWEQLQTHRPTIKPANSLQRLTDLLGPQQARGAQGILALAIHGTRGADGWTQAKQLPSGETLTSGHVLQWHVPPLVVGASCNTDIRSDAGGELGGFPLAFQLRGAVRIIGSLHAIEDEATSQMMALFYAATSEGLAAAQALRVAQRAWIGADPVHRFPAMQRWAYLLCYGPPA